MTNLGDQNTLQYEDDLANHRAAVQAHAYNEAKQHLLSAINLMAVDGHEQKMAVDMLARMEAAGRSPDEIMATLAIHLRDICLQ